MADKLDKANNFLGQYMKLDAIYSAINTFFRIVSMRDIWIFSNGSQKILILTSALLNVVDTGVKLLAPLALAEVIEMVGDSQSEGSYLGFEVTAKNLIYATATLNLIHAIIPELKKIVLYNVSESLSYRLSQKINEKALKLALSTDQNLLPNLTSEVSKHLYCADAEINGLLSSVTESIHPMLLDTIIGVTFTGIRFEGYVASILIVYIIISMITNEILSYITNLPSKESEKMLLQSKFLSYIYSLIYKAETVFLFGRENLENRNLSDLYSKYNSAKKSVMLRERCCSIQALLTCALQFAAAAYATKNDFNDIDLDHIIFLFNYVVNIAGGVNVINNSYRSTLTSINNIDEITEFLNRNSINEVRLLSGGITEATNDNTNDLTAPLLSASSLLSDENLASSSKKQRKINSEPVSQCGESIQMVSMNDFSSDIAVKFESVSFSYGQSAPLLDSLSFTIPSGSTVAIVGASNCGKTTITKLLLGLLTPSSANSKISFFGRPVNTISFNQLRDLIGIVRQDVDILDGDTAKYNILYGFADDDDLYKIKSSESQAAAIDPSLEIKLKKIGRLTSTQGILKKGMCNSLSGGEKQRLAIARVVGRNSRIIILDEATSQLDSRTEANILGNIKDLFHGKTMIIIAHRLYTIKHADMILVLKNFTYDLVLMSGEEKRLDPWKLYVWIIEEGGQYFLKYKVLDSVKKPQSGIIHSNELPQEVMSILQDILGPGLDESELNLSQFLPDILKITSRNGHTQTGTKILEQGKHDELIKLNGEYAELWKLQTQTTDTAPQPRMK